MACTTFVNRKTKVIKKSNSKNKKYRRVLCKRTLSTHPTLYRATRWHGFIFTCWPGSEVSIKAYIQLLNCYYLTVILVNGFI